MKVLITAPLGKTVYPEIEKAVLDMGYEVDRIDELELKDHFEYKDCDILICYDPFKFIDFRKAHTLKAIIMVSAGVDQIPDYILDNENIQIINNNGAYSIPIAEWIMMCLLMGIKNYPAIIQKQKDKNWEIEKNTLEFDGMNVLFLGSGGIATEASKRLKAFGANRIAYRRTHKEHSEFDRTVFDDTIDEEIAKADAIVVCLPDTDATRKFVSAERISNMKDGAIFINISRGTIVDQEALIKALKSGKFRFVALDVLENEPLGKESEIWNLDRLFLSTHTSWISQNRPKRLKKHILENLDLFMKTGKLLRQINRRSKY